MEKENQNNNPDLSEELPYNNYEGDSLDESISVEQSEAITEDTETDNTVEQNIVDPEEPKLEKKPKKRKRRSTIRTVVLAIFIIAVSIGISYMIITGMNDIFALSKPNTTAVIEIPMGSSTSEITTLLHEHNIINNAWTFKLVLALRDDSGEFQSGTHYFNAQWDYETIIEELKTIPDENANTVKITFKEGITLEEIAELLEQNEVCKAKTFIETINNPSGDYEFLNYLKKTDTSLKYYSMEGYAFPDTYTFYKNEGAEVVVNKLLSEFDQKMSDANLYSLIEATDFTLDEVITLASIIQSEAGTADDMLLISSVLHNRINNSDEYPKLECDPTKNYSKWILGNMKDNNNVDESIATAYDTYTTEGLPPGAICNPGVAAIRAVLNPSNTNYYYFCANLETKECFYAITYDEHVSNLEKAGLT